MNACSVQSFDGAASRLFELYNRIGDLRLSQSFILEDSYHFVKKINYFSLYGGREENRLSFFCITHALDSGTLYDNTTVKL